MLGRKDFVEAKMHQTINLELKKSRMMLVNQARELVKATGQEKGIILCPICKKELDFQFVPETQLVQLKCSTENCIDVNELGQE